MKKKQTQQFTIKGKVSDLNNFPLKGFYIEAFEKQLRKEILLGQRVQTDNNGRYEMFFESDQTPVAVLMKVYTNKIIETPFFVSSIDETVYNFTGKEEINVIIRESIPKKEDDFSMILEKISPYLGSLKISELGEDQTDFKDKTKKRNNTENKKSKKNKPNEDIVFLSKETEIGNDKLISIVLAHRMSDDIKTAVNKDIEPAFFYGLLQKRILLKNKFMKHFLSIDISKLEMDRDLLIYNASLTDESRVIETIQEAKNEMLIGESVYKGDGIYEILKPFRESAENYFKKEFPQKLIEVLSDFFLSDASLNEPNQSLGGVSISYEKISINPNYHEIKAKVYYTLIGALDYDEELITKIKKDKLDEDLAKISMEDWNSSLTNLIGFDVAGKKLEESDVEYFAEMLFKKYEKKYPSISYFSSREVEKGSGDDIINFIKSKIPKEKTIDLLSTNIDKFFKENKINTEENNFIRKKLKSIQRVFRLIPEYSKAEILLSNGIHSAQTIISMGEDQFLSKTSGDFGFNNFEADEILRRARNIHLASMLALGELQDSIRSMDIPAIKLNSDLNLKVQTKNGKSKRVKKNILEQAKIDIPDLKSLFYMRDMCSCEHCKSVYSPAAYLVDIIEYMDKVPVVDKTDEANPLSSNAKDIFFERRPDIGFLDLNCGNAETRVPYIDLICELLEDEVSPKLEISWKGKLSDEVYPYKGKISKDLADFLVKNNISVTYEAQISETEKEIVVEPISISKDDRFLRDRKAVCKISFVEESSIGEITWSITQSNQTLSSEEELAAAPYYKNQLAYDTLKDSELAFDLPFDLDQVEAKEYFNRFNVSRADLMKVFRKEGKSSILDVAAEILSLTEKEKYIIINGLPDNQDSFWGIVDSVDKMKKVNFFLKKTQITYEALELLISLDFIRQQTNLYIKIHPLSPEDPIDPCNVETKLIMNLDKFVLDRIHRFLRLQKKTGWKFEILDEIISQKMLGKGLLNDKCLIVVSQIKMLNESTGIKIEELICFYGEIPHKFHPTIKSTLYDTIFQSKARNGIIEEKLSYEKIKGNELLKDFSNSLSICFQINENEFTKLTKYYELEKFGISLETDPPIDLPVANLSFLLAIIKLSKILNLSFDDLFILNKLKNLNIFNSPLDTLTFLEFVNESRSFTLKLIDLIYILTPPETDKDERGLDETAIKNILTRLKSEYKKVDDSNNSPYDENLTSIELKDPIFLLFSKLERFNKEEIEKFLNCIQAKKLTEKDLVWINEFINYNLILFFNVVDLKTFFKELSDLLNTPKIDQEKVESKRKEILKSLFATGLMVLEKTDKLTIVLSEIFKPYTSLISTILKSACLKRQDIKVGLIRDLLILLPTSEKPGDNMNQFSSLRLLHKMFPLIDSFKLELMEIDWLMKNNSKLSWLEFDAIPYEKGIYKVDVSKYSSLVQFVSLKNKFSPVVNPSNPVNPITFFELFGLLFDEKNSKVKELNEDKREVFLKNLSMLTGYSYNHVTSIDNYFEFSKKLTAFPVFYDMSKYREIETWKKIGIGVEYFRTLNISIDQLSGIIKLSLTSKDTSNLRMALKSRYDEYTWFETLKEIMNKIRPKKRDALVSYLLGTFSSKWKSENDLFDYLLVDVKMESCMPSSRIVLSHLSIQLFLQRCLMGLEPKASPVITDGSIKGEWNQWKWMKNYRIWEANRKVFLYPENWIEPELRDNKTYMFRDLENELLQNEINNENCEIAIKNYLEKLDDISFIEVVATYYESYEELKHTLHVIGRSKEGNPPLYYYRKFLNLTEWTSWEKIDLDISSNLLLLFMYNQRLFLSWAIINEEQVKPKETDVPTGGGKYPMVNNNQLAFKIAISEYSNNKWRSKRISNESVKTQPVQGNDPEHLMFKQNLYSLRYLDGEIQIIKCEEFDSKYSRIGAFKVFGIRGYIELARELENEVKDLLPYIADCKLENQRFTRPKNPIHKYVDFNFGKIYKIFKKTPIPYRVSFPIQELEGQEVIQSFSNVFGKIGMTRPITSKEQLPYYFEDTEKSYSVVPIKLKKDKNFLNTLSYYFHLSKKYSGIKNYHIANSSIIDSDSRYISNSLREFINFFISFSKDVEDRKHKFNKMYHPYIGKLLKTLKEKGVSELLKRETQLDEEELKECDGVPSKTIFECRYDPTSLVFDNFPKEKIDFELDESYSIYNWELFFHIPFAIATMLTRNQRFEEAMDWYHYIFNPVGVIEKKVESKSQSKSSKYWMTKPFFERQSLEYSEQDIYKLLMGNISDEMKHKLEDSIRDWRQNPFKPDVVARQRTISYQKAIVIKYIDNLIEWADFLFRQDTMESIAQATHLYLMAEKLLGEKPVILKGPQIPTKNYNQLETIFDSFGNVLVNIENLLLDFPITLNDDDNLSPLSVDIPMLYFCIPHNEKLFEYWGRIEDRLFKIRHCKNIYGIERTLALFAPPIDPALIIRALASGLDISNFIAELNSPPPHYRFSIISQKASDLAQEVRTLGNSLLQALEKKDSEQLALLRSNQEISILKAVRNLKIHQIEESKIQIDILQKSKTITEEKYSYYSNIQKIIPFEQLNLDKLRESNRYQILSQIYPLAASIFALLPDIKAGGSGFGGSPHFVLSWGGLNLTNAAIASTEILKILGGIASHEASTASILGGYERRFEDWKLQERLSKKELSQIEKQITAAELRKEIAETELKNHDLQIENANATDEFIRTKYTNSELYGWTIGQISSVYFKAYQMAFNYAKKAERCFQLELGERESIIQVNYWDNLKKGLQSADNLIYDIKRLETTFLEKNKREFELTKHISLSLINPDALLQLKVNNTCNFDIPEVLFDIDNPGNFFRRIKSVSISIPCISGPYSTINCKLSLISSKYRRDDKIPEGYVENPIGGDLRFKYDNGDIQSIITSHAQNDNGLFEFNLRDERYLPFEGYGAVSSWKLELPKDYKSFDYDTISDVIIHLKYTSRDSLDGGALKNQAIDSIKKKLALINENAGLLFVLDLKTDLSNSWQQIKETGKTKIKIEKSKLPYFLRLNGIDLKKLNLFAALKPVHTSLTIEAKIGGVQLNTIDLKNDNPSYGELLYASLEADSFLDLDLEFSILDSSGTIWKDLENFIIIAFIKFKE